MGLTQTDVRGYVAFFSKFSKFSNNLKLALV